MIVFWCFDFFLQDYNNVVDSFYTYNLASITKLNCKNNDYIQTGFLNTPHTLPLAGWCDNPAPNLLPLVELLL